MLFTLPSTLLPTLLLLLSTPTTAYKPLSDTFLRAISSPETALDAQNGTLLAPLLIPRVPGTPGQTLAQQHLVSYFKTELPAWNISWQNSTSTTPTSRGAELPFANLVVKREPPWVSKGQANLLTLVAHYDSKLQPSGFIGATDSAAPCAMLMHIAKLVDPYIQRMYDEMSALQEGGTVDMDMGIQILFLDGEEAFENWSDTDSLYGSRSLAQEWASTSNPPSAASKFYHNRTPLSQISLFMLLDLLGSASPTVPSYFPTTHWAYRHLSTIESRLRDLKLLESQPSSPFLPDVNRTMGGGGISDDHLPFMSQGVEILHVIPSPFPRVWHTMEDDGAHLDGETVRDWCKIVGAFVLEWLDMMEVWDEPSDGAGRRRWLA
ncbi:glutaminyl-peptide cyclotransferase [Alternaria panax]|uniref:Peptide hydrolase n=1 Tax=Alternaria panax TaxID=48097 RepID=A0AAD4NPL3_9PLEO|nr:glutaminyl-peptide cyclotransferase [Alternaria panax]